MIAMPLTLIPSTKDFSRGRRAKKVVELPGGRCGCVFLMEALDLLLRKGGCGRQGVLISEVKELEARVDCGSFVARGAGIEKTCRLGRGRDGQHIPRSLSMCYHRTAKKDNRYLETEEDNDASAANRTRGPSKFAHGNDGFYH
jgi:hypothetical protein